MFKQRLFAIVLISSLALNLFIGGILIGGYFQGHPPPHPMRPNLHWMIQSLPEKSKIKIRPLMQAFRPNMFSQMQGIKEARQAVHRKLTAVNFNKESLSQALEHLRQEMGTMQQRMHGQLIEIAGLLDAKERQQLSEATHRKPFR
ncbi:MAG: periplasmic heavy metal sensor [Thiomargarita sp.]|nr:periplasmic heavy metal sensor [Thiomargarita sp.]